MDVSINGQSKVPPGFRFHPTEEELLNYYLRKKVAQEKMEIDVIPYVDLNKVEPWDIQERCKIGSTPQNEWYFFSHKDKKYPTGTRTNRATEAGFWKATGRDKVVHNNGKRIGLRKTLVFYIGRAPCGQKSDWIMYEYRLDDNTTDANVCNLGEPKDDGWVVCRLFKKKNHSKSNETSPQTLSSTSKDIWNIDQLRSSSNDGDLNEILRCIVKPCKQENETKNNDNSINMKFQTLLESQDPPVNIPPFNDDQDSSFDGFSVEDMFIGIDDDDHHQGKFGNKITTVDELGFHLDDDDHDHQYSKLSHLCSNRAADQAFEAYGSDMDVWSFT